MATTLRYPRVLIKLSGEALKGDKPAGVDPATLEKIVKEIAEIAATGAEVALVVGGGNLFRGSQLAQVGVDRVTGDQIGMLATVMNALTLKHALEKIGASARVLSAITIQGLCEVLDRDQAMRHLAERRIVIFAGGTGNPLFTTDSAASLRAIEIKADLLIKATKHHGIFAQDPALYPNATHLPQLTYDEVLQQQLAVMDQTAIILCRDHQLPLRVVSLYQSGAMTRAVMGEEIGSIVTTKEPLS